jgi:hypothetical protein
MKQLFESLQELADTQREVEESFINDSENFWQSLTYEQKLLAFSAVMTRLVKGELQDQGSYRYVLYDIFGFGPESYGIGMITGFIDLHNSIERK